jgi:hypothetical protein
MLEIQKRHKEKHAAANQEKKRLDAQAADLAEQLTKLEPLTGLDAQLHTAEALYQEWLDTAQAISKGVELQRQWHAATRAQQHCGAVADTLDALVVPPELTPTEHAAKLIAELTKVTILREQAAAECAATTALVEPPRLPATEPLAELAKAIDRFERAVARASGEDASLRDLEAPPVLDNEFTLRRLIGELTGTQTECQRIGAEHESLQPLRPVPEPESLTALQTLADALQHWHHEVTRRQQAHATLANLQPLPVADDPSPLARTIDQLQAAAEQCAVQQIAWQAVSAEYAAAGEELAAVASETTCPTCGQAFDPQRLLDVTVSQGGHPHG